MNKFSFARRLSVSASAFLLASLLVTLAGCGGKGSGAKNTVSGKVTMNGQVVAGQVVFVGGNKEYPSPIGPDGNYQIIDPPNGEYVVLVKPPIGGTISPKGVGGGKGSDLPGTGAGTGTPPPAKYGTAAGGLKFTVSGGEQKNDIDLKP